MINNVIRAIYAYKYQGNIKDLKVEGEVAQGFEAWPTKKLVNGLPDNERKRFIPFMLENKCLEIYKKIEALL
ncbi:MAG: hypothetical protein ACD_24C00081G0009 [uncultured bacterium]|uniref:Uncharacterized protein n=1 Tax=Candidatus Woesebacteria bacterium RIFCSPHIGHO2_12_FULL_41_24 TaxID=1802510 RepID=A0A1F8AQT4_9BACT|nr:MAG: hypothetical protein ACD_24C00081G0009 [uncultured bacterium]OGM13431.1 MAG: hypothetical protein A2W15_06060 [Candidatus Woesebacteria bacterium RBG_16_41_13]OGM35975.1 MAG: hypothetical protein A3D84_01850 [Candidatus Woesebacteria bacterium RIFCSPHIGHO2_02_FULL_42_20]OGM54133.1 MAG: hypothetical protein A3E44_00410 [Candidatus Woesebacteria bacterium RIFCSPHIGHO2_12_FULL_41_24]OGM72015.1 MAG: hypothetical protein A3H21_01115 [Candidatus Woesebacteria bacterium RIFCSPLOWO2_12_FULL_42_